VDGGIGIPLEQILAGSRRDLLKFESSVGDRSTGQMISGRNAQGLPQEVQAKGWKPGKKEGWEGLTKEQVVTYQPESSRELSAISSRRP